MDADARPNAAELTVSELSAALKRTVEDAYGYVRLRGEISGFKGPHSSGHCYFSLKDEGARIEAVVWRQTFQRMKFKPEEGLEVVVTGRVTTYPARSNYQIVIDTLEPAGAGALMALLEERKKKLAKEGLFDDARKQLLPFLPKVIGVVTSPTGAVIRDILHRLNDRFARHVLVWPVRVQGETAAAEVAAAIAGFNALVPGGKIPRPDVLIVARGGGSLEDLWSFNEEVVVRTAAASDIPLISAVGHETDVTLIDFASDRRAPTPTAAAEIAVPVRSELLAQTAALAARQIACWQRGLEQRRKELRSLVRALPTRDRLFEGRRQRLDNLAERLPQALRANAQLHHRQLASVSARLSPQILRGRIAQGKERADVLGRRAERSWDAYLTRRYDRLEALEQLLQAFSYRRVLARGYALVRDENDKPVRAAAGIATGARLDIEFADGRVKTTAGETQMRPPAAPRPARRRQRLPNPDQGDLF